MQDTSCQTQIQKKSYSFLNSEPTYIRPNMVLCFTGSKKAAILELIVTGKKDLAKTKKDKQQYMVACWQRTEIEDGRHNTFLLMLASDGFLHSQLRG